MQILALASGTGSTIVDNVKKLGPFQRGRCSARIHTVAHPTRKRTLPHPEPIALELDGMDALCICKDRLRTLPFSLLSHKIAYLTLANLQNLRRAFTCPRSWPV